MKNIFKMMGIALMACSLMVACGNKDEDEPIDTTPVTPPAPTSSVKVVWDGVEQTLGFTDAYQSSQSEKLFWFEGAKSLVNNEYEYPAFVVPFYNGDGGFYPACLYSFITNEGDTVSGNYYFRSEVFNEGGLEVSGQVVGDYQLYGFNGNALPELTWDASAKKLSGAFSLRFYDYAAAQAGQSIFKDLDLTFVEYPFDAAK